MKAKLLVVTTLVLAAFGLALAEGKALPKPGVGVRPGPRVALMAETLGMTPDELRTALKRRGLPALLRKKGLTLEAFRRAMIENALKRLEAAYDAGRVSKLRYREAKARLEARLLALKVPRLGELVKRSGGDLKKLQSEIKAAWRSEIEALYRLGLLSAKEKGRLLAELDARVKRMLARPLGLPMRPQQPRLRRPGRRPGQAPPPPLRRRR